MAVWPKADGVVEAADWLNIEELEFAVDWPKTDDVAAESLPNKLEPAEAVV